MTDQVNFNELVKSSVDQAVMAHLNPLIQQSLDNLILDQAWLDQVEQRALQHVREKTVGRINNVDFAALLREQVDQALERWRGLLLEKFSSTGITDSATATQLVIQDEAVVVNTALAAVDLVIERDASISGSLRVKDLAITGDINTDNRAWQRLTEVVTDQVSTRIDQEWRDRLVQEILTISRSQGINFKDIRIDGTVVIDKEHIADSVKTSSLEQVGTLRDLTVAGPTQLTNTLAVTPRRVGINTQDPEMALAVWDEEVNVLVGKHAKDGAYIGTGRKQQLNIGTDRKTYLAIDEDGVMTLKKNLRIDRFQLGFTDTTPGFSGTRGDFLLNSDPREGQPFAWVCLGGFKWQVLKAA
jgi:hypothetical protein